MICALRGKSGVTVAFRTSAARSGPNRSDSDSVSGSTGAPRPPRDPPDRVCVIVTAPASACSSASSRGTPPVARSSALSWTTSR